MMNNVLILRKQRGMTQDEFAEFCGISRISVARYEAGASVSRDAAIAIANACSVPISYVLGESDFPADDTWDIRERLRRDPDMRVLFDAAAKASPEHLKAAAAMLKALEPPEEEVE